MQQITPWSAFRQRVLLALLVAAFAAPLLATSERLTSDTNLVDQSTLIVIGRCHRAVAEWHGRALVTRAEIEVETTLKGTANETVSVYIPGGVDLDRAVPITVTVPSAPVLAAGERVLLFLSPIDGHDGFAISGFSQGKRQIATSASGTQRVAVGGSTLSLDNAKSWVLEQVRKAGDNHAR